MSDRNEVRVSDQDPEMVAVKALAAALEPLDIAARRRVLKWAGDKYVDHARDIMREEVLGRIQAEMEGMQEHAKRLGVSDAQLVGAFAAVRQRHKLAPVDKLTPDALRDAEAEIERIAAPA